LLRSYPISNGVDIIPWVVCLLVLEAILAVVGILGVCLFETIVLVVVGVHFYQHCVVSYSEKATGNFLRDRVR